MPKKPRSQLHYSLLSELTELTYQIASGGLEFSPRPFSCDVISGWGRHDSDFWVSVNSAPLLDYKDRFKLMLILAIPYSNIDKMSDTSIEKSVAFTITGEPILIAVGLTATPQHLRVSRPPNTKAGDTFTRLINFTLVLIPTTLTPEQIRSLSDVETLGKHRTMAA